MSVNFRSKHFKKILSIAIAVLMVVQFLPPTYTYAAEANLNTEGLVGEYISSSEPAETSAVSGTTNTDETVTEQTQPTEETSAPAEIAEGAKAVTAWAWVDELAIIDSETNTATVPGVSADNPIDLETLIGFLPASITATVNGVQEPLALTWSCDSFPETATGGKYTFTAALPEGYALAEGVGALILTVDLGGAERQLEYDSDTGTYYISTMDDLNQFAAGINNGTIDTLSSVTVTASFSGTLTAPIGTSSHPYEGSFNGNGNTITVTYAFESGYDFEGLFGYVKNDYGMLTVKDLTLDVAGYSTQGAPRYFGFLCGFADGGYFSNCTVKFSIITTSLVIPATMTVGGLLGYAATNSNSGLTLYECTVATNEILLIYATEAYYGIGGLIGVLEFKDSDEAFLVNQCAVYNLHLSAGLPYAYTGGLFGYATNQYYAIYYDITIQNSYFAGALDGSNPIDQCGGYFGYLMGDRLFSSGYIKFSRCYSYLFSTLGCGIAPTTESGDFDSFYFENCYYSDNVISDLNSDLYFEGVKSYTETQRTSGELCYLLGSPFVQQLGVDDYPNLHSADYPVSKNCQGTYNNDGIEGHNYINGICSVCAKFEAATVSNGTVQIANAGQLYWFAAHVNGDTSNCVSVNSAVTAASNAVLTDNITDNTNVVVDGVVQSGDFRTWTPIGKSNSGYTGTFDGDGHTVSGLYAYLDGTYYTGLIGVLGPGGQVANVGVVQSYFSAVYTGAIVGSCGEKGTTNGTAVVENCYSSQNVIVCTTYDVGGIVGSSWLPDVTITKCWNDSPIGTKSTGGMGGILGYVYSGTCRFEYCYNIGTVTNSANYAGGILGWMDEGTSVYMNYCYNAGAVSASITPAQFVGFFSDVVALGLKYCAATTEVWTGSDATLAIDDTVKAFADFSTGEVAWFLNAGVTDGTQPYYQLIGTDSYPNLKSTGSNTVYSGLVGFCGAGYTAYRNTEIVDVAETHDYTDNNGFCIYCGAYQPAVDTDSDSYYEIGNAGQLYWFASLVNGTLATTCNDTTTGQNTSANALLTANITVNESVVVEGVLQSGSFRSWTPIGTKSYNYAGDFDGDEHYVSGLYYSGSLDAVGLVGYATTNFSIQNVTVKGSYLYSSDSTNGRVGAIVGGAWCTSPTAVLITGCAGEDNLIRSANFAGGIAGASGGTISGCYNTGTVKGDNSCAGGIVGALFTNIKVEDCYNLGAVNAPRYVGGIAGIAQNKGANITRCYNAGTISVSDRSVAGIIGGVYATTVTNCYNIGTISGSLRVGAIAGYYYNNYATKNTVTNCYNAGTLTATSSTPYFCPATESTTKAFNVTNCYYLDTTGSFSVDGLTAKTATEFASGEVTWLLNGETAKNAVFRQDIDNGVTPYDEFPNFTDAIVYYGALDCNNMDNAKYTNDTETGPHLVYGHNFANGFCVNVLLNDDSTTRICDQYEQAILVTGTDGDTLDDDTPYTAYYTVLGLTVDHDGYYAVQNAGQLFWFAAKINGASGWIDDTLQLSLVLLDNIDANPGFTFGSDSSITYTGEEGDSFTPRAWVPIGSGSYYFSGNVDGNGKTVSGLYCIDNATIDTGRLGAAAFIGTLYNDDTDVDEVKDLHVKNSYFEASSYAAGIIGHGRNCVVTGCTFDGTVKSQAYAGGIVSYSRIGITISGCESYGSINTLPTETNQSVTAGGILGSGVENVSITGCTNYAAVNAAVAEGYIAGHAGGIVGDAGTSNYTGTITDCHNRGTITGSGSAGGIAASVTSVTVQNCSNTGAVTGYLGKDTNNTSAAGIVGVANSSTVSLCYNIGTVSVPQTGTGYAHTSAAGVCLISRDGTTIENCYNAGSVSADHAAGVLRDNESGGTLKNAHSVGEITAKYKAAGICVTNVEGASISNCYSNHETLIDTNSGTAENVETRTDEAFASGEVAFLLNGSQPTTADADTSALVWMQNLDNGEPVDAYPNFTGAVVYGITGCQGVVSYSNDPSTGSHNFVNGFCINSGADSPVCDKYQSAVLVTEDNVGEFGFTDTFYVNSYAISNAGQLYWMAEHVNGTAETGGKVAEYVEKVTAISEFVLVADITVNEDMSDSNSNRRTWTPIGTAAIPFAGILWGEGHTVSGIYVNTEADNAGLFGYVSNQTNPATIQDIRLKNSVISSTGNNVGGIAGYVYGCLITNAAVLDDCTVSGNNNVGGMVGYVKYLYHSNAFGNSIEFCWNEAAVSGANKVGGIAGFVEENDANEETWSSVVISPAYNTGAISATGVAGGIVGSVSTTYMDTCQVNSCHNVGTVSGTTVGGIAGSVSALVSIEYCYSLTEPIGEEVTVDTGDTGSTEDTGDTGDTGSTEDTVERNEVSVKTAEQFASGEVAWLLNNMWPNETWTEDMLTEENLSYIFWRQKLGEGGDSYPIFDSDMIVFVEYNCMEMPGRFVNDFSEVTHGAHTYSEHGFCGNSGTTETDDGTGNITTTVVYCYAYEPATSVTEGDYTGYYAIENAGQLFWAAALVNGELTDEAQNRSANFVLLSDIDLSVAPEGLLWTPLGIWYSNHEYSYKGTFDGGYHVVENFTVEHTGEAGFFGRTESATVKNLGVVGADITAYGYRAGIFAGEIHKSTVTNCFAVGKVTVESTSTVQRGAFAGEAAASTLTNCFAWDQSVDPETAEPDPAEFYPNYASDNGSALALPTSLTNSYCYAATDGVTDPNNLGVTYKTADQFASGEVAWLLNGKTSENAVWLQTLAGDASEGDAYPTFTGETVYYIATCVKVDGYSNDESQVKPYHTFSANGFCTNSTEAVVDADTGEVTTPAELCNAYQPAVDSDGDGIYEIGNAGQLYWFAVHVNLADPTQDDNVDEYTVNTSVIFKGDVTNTSVVLTADIDLGDVPEGVTWRPIGMAGRDFQRATFDGNGKTIRNFSYAGYTDYPPHVNNYQVDGLFCYAKNATVKDFTIEGTMKTVYEGGTNKSFGVIGWTVGTTTVSNIHSKLHFDFSEIPIAVQNVGGIVGKCENTTTITGCTFSGTITGPTGYAVTNVGGIAGTLGEGHTATITDCTFSGQIIGTSTTAGTDCVGGIVGTLPKNAKITITDCTFTEDASISVERGWKLAGILGQIEHTGAFATIQRCASWGSITVNPIEDIQHLSGVVSYVHPSSSYLIEDCGFYGSITNLSDTYKVSYAGGMISYQRSQGNGWTGVIRNCLSVGTFSGLFDEGSLGAIAGRLAYYTGSTNTYTLENNYYRYDSDTDCTAPTPISPYNTTTDTTALPFTVDGTTDTIAKTEAELNSGEVTWLLNGSLPEYEGDSTDLSTLVWRQALVGNNIDPYPVFDSYVVYPYTDGSGYYNVDVVSVNITYGEMIFSYTEVWDPETHTYNGMWAPKNADGDLVTVENNGTVKLNVTLVCTEAHAMEGSGLADDGVTVSLTNWLLGSASTTPENGTVPLAVGEILSVQVAVSGTPNETFSPDDTGRLLGQLTVSVAKAAE